MIGRGGRGGRGRWPWHDDLEVGDLEDLHHDEGDASHDGGHDEGDGAGGGGDAGGGEAVVACPLVEGLGQGGHELGVRGPRAREHPHEGARQPRDPAGGGGAFPHQGQGHVGHHPPQAQGGDHPGEEGEVDQVLGRDPGDEAVDPRLRLVEALAQEEVYGLGGAPEGSGKDLGVEVVAEEEEDQNRHHRPQEAVDHPQEEEDEGEAHPRVPGRGDHRPVDQLLKVAGLVPGGEDGEEGS
jgi:hypothetical protein